MLEDKLEDNQKEHRKEQEIKKKNIDIQIKERNEKVVEEKDMTINMDPAIAAIFRSSSAVSGKQHMLKAHLGV